MNEQNDSTNNVSNTQPLESPITNQNQEVLQPVEHTDIVAGEPLDPIGNNTTSIQSAPVVAAEVPEAVSTPTTIVEVPQVVATPDTVVEVPQVVATPTTIVEVPQVVATPDTVVEVPQVVATPDTAIETPQVVATPTPIVDSPQVSMDNVQQQTTTTQTILVNEQPETLEPINSAITTEPNLVVDNNTQPVPSTTTIENSTTPATTGVNINSEVGFVATSSPLPKKKSKFSKFFKSVGIILVVLLIAVVAIFIAQKVLFSNPKTIYELSIKTIFKGVTNTIEDVVYDKAIYDAKLTLDSNIPVFQSYSGYTYEANIGFDPTLEAVQAGISLEKSSSKYSMFGYIKDGKKYSRYSLDNELNFLGNVPENETDELFASFKKILEYSNKANSEEINYVIDKISNLIVESINEDKLLQEDATITLNGKTIKARNNKLIIDEETKKNMSKHILDGLKNDKKVVSFLSKLLNRTEEQIQILLTFKEAEDNTELKKDMENQKNSTIIINIYTAGFKNDIVGFAVNNEDKSIDFHVYFNTEFFEMKFYYITKNLETNKDLEYKLQIDGQMNSGKTNISVKFNEQELLRLVITEFTTEKLSLTYEVLSAGVKEPIRTGTFSYSIANNGKRSNTSYKFTLKGGTQYINLDLDFTIDWTSSVANINTGTAKTLTDEEIKAKQEAFMKQLYNTPIGTLFETSSGDVTSGVEDYYTNDSYYISDSLVNPTI